MFDPFVIQAASGAYAIDQRDSRQASHPHARRSSVSDSHLTETDHVAPFVVAICDNVGPILDCQFHFVLCHGCLIQEVTGPFPDFPVDQLWDGREIEIHTSVDDLDFEAVLA